MKGGREGTYYLQVPRVPPSRKYLQARMAIPDDIVHELGIKPNDEVELVSLEVVKNERYAEIFNDSKIDLLATLPEFSHSKRPLMADLFTKDGEEWMRVWYSAGQLVDFVNSIVKGAEWSVDVFYNAGLTSEATHQNLQNFLKNVKISPRRISL